MDPYNQQYQQNPQYQQYPQYDPFQQYQQPVNPTCRKQLIISILQLFFAPPFLGFIPLVLTILANISWKEGRYEDYQNRTEMARGFIVIGWVAAALQAFVMVGLILYFYAMVTSGF